MTTPGLTAHPTLSLCMIVKDEERFLEDCLRSVQGVVDEIVLVDTGSTDGTLAIAERHGAKVIHFPWTGDFAAARNVSLEHATGDWILVLDADERLEEASRPKLKLLLLAEDVAGYSLICENLVAAGHGDQSQQAPVFRLFRNRLEIRFEGMIHEQAITSARLTGLKACTSEVTIRHLGYVAEEVERRDKRQRNLAILERQVATEPENPFVHFNLGEVLKLLGRLEEAEIRYREAMRLLKAAKASHGASYYANLYFSLGDLYRELGRFPEAHALLDEAIALYPRFADLYYTKGFAYFDAGRYAEAIECFLCCPRHAGVRHPFATDPGIPGHKALRAIADCHIKLGDRRQAKTYLERALRLHPHPDAALYSNLGILLLDSGQEVEAIRHFEQAREQDPDDLQAWLNLLYLWLQRQSYSAVASAWPRCPADDVCRGLSALALSLSGATLPEARPADETLIRIWGEAVEAAIATNRTGMVQDLLDRLDELGSALPGLEFALGQIFLRHRLFELAIGALLLARERAPQEPRIYCALGDASLAAGGEVDAQVMYTQALQLAPGDAHAARQLERLASLRKT